MTTLKQAAQQALDYIRSTTDYKMGHPPACEAAVDLADALENQFNPDWDQVEALQESLREHMAEIQRLRTALADHNEESLEMVEPVASVTVEQLAKMAESMEGIDSTQPGYQWRKGWNDALRRAMDCAAPPPAKPAQEPVAQCPHCNGSGDIVVMDSAGPDALEVPAPCPHCGGSGSLADAYHGVVKLLEKKSDDYLKCCAELYVRPIAPRPAKREPLTDEEIDRVTDAQWARNNHKPIYAAHRAYARAIEDAIWSKT
jgi:hypothetical protein